MRCFVTGGAGFVGSHAVRLMLKEGWEVAVLTLPGERTAGIDDLSGRLEIFAADLADSPAIRDLLFSWRPEACLHCAWYVEPGRYLNSPANIDCLKNSLALLEELIRAGCKSVVMVGSCAEYDVAADFLKETSAVRPATLYAASKLATLLVAEKRAAQAGMSFAWARLFHLFGPGEDERRMVPALIRSLLAGRSFPATDGNQIRDFLYIEDAASGLVQLLSSATSGVYNVCSGEPISVRQMMQAVGHEIGRADLIQFGAVRYREDWEPPFLCGDSSRLRALGWRPQREMREAVRLTIEYWRAATQRPEGDYDENHH